MNVKATSASTAAMQRPISWSLTALWACVIPGRKRANKHCAAPTGECCKNTLSTPRSAAFFLCISKSILFFARRINYSLKIIDLINDY
ncbi:hypothetical protein GSZ44_000567 [Salmonella enterica]|nr:hypothetical protein [Salmonella enterica]